MSAPPADASRWWRRELTRDLARLRRARTFRRWSEKKTALFERRLVLVGAQIGALLDERIFPPSVASQPLGCVRYPPTGAVPDGPVERGVVPRLFALDAPVPASLAAREVCNHLVRHALLAAVTHEPRQFTHLWLVPPGGEEGLLEIEVQGLLEFLGRFSRNRVRPVGRRREARPGADGAGASTEGGGERG